MKKRSFYLVVSWRRNTQAIARGSPQAGKKEPINSPFDVMFELYIGKLDPCVLCVNLEYFTDLHLFYFHKT